MLRRGTDSVVLIDFGIARIRASLIAPGTVSHTTAGTLPYMSPEQLRGEKVTAASDVYSMGIVAYEMVTGTRPFNPASAAQLLEMQRTGIRVRPRQHRENLPVEADRAICRALRFEPRARYQRAGEFGDELSRALLAKPKPNLTRRIPKWAKVTAGLIILAAVSWGIYRYISHRIKLPSHSFTYFLTVQKIGDGKEYRSNGDEDIFEPGDKFQLNVTAPEPGYLYVFNERPPQPNDTGFTMIYPRKNISDGSSTLGANQVFQSDWNTFSGPPGNENFWIVWSISAVPQLESAKTEAFTNVRAAFSGDTLITVRDFLTKPREFKTIVYHYKESQKAIAHSKGDLLITLAQFKHR